MSQFRKPGDWDCPKCNDHQFARNSHCRKCGAAKPGSEYHDLETTPSPQPRFFREFKRGDWSCIVCGDHQFARNTECRRCGSPKNAGELSQEELHRIWNDFMDRRPKRYCDSCRTRLDQASDSSSVTNQPEKETAE
jgi:predicted RNA-binding Zn-ribbon protein involved in translation (DUF1610 family)